MLLAGLIRAVEERFRIALVLSHPPDAVADQKRVEDVRADEEGIVRLEMSAGRWPAPVQDGARQQHAERLAADQPGADHAPADLHDVVKGEVALCELEHAFVARNHHAQQSFSRDLPASARAVPRLIDSTIPRPG